MAPIQVKSFNKVCWKNDIESIKHCKHVTDYNETKRINNKIKKARQIPKEFKGLLYNSIAPLYFMTTDMTASIERLEANIKKHSLILCSSQ